MTLIYHISKNTLITINGHDYEHNREQNATSSACKHHLLPHPQLCLHSDLIALIKM